MVGTSIDFSVEIALTYSVTPSSGFCAGSSVGLASISPAGTVGC